MAPTKIASIAIISTGVVGGGIGTVYAFSPSKSKPIATTTIAQKLANEALTVLSDSEEARWAIKLHTYNHEVKNSNTEINLGGKLWGDLKSWCERKLKDVFKTTNNRIYEGIKKICTAPSNKEKLASANKTLATSDEDWGKRKTAYDKANDNELITGIQKNTENKEAIKQWCETALKEEYQGDQKNKYPLVAKWCVNDPA
ncbi:hypothetical protein A6V39_03755 [Candidatus Mycoplasma haematobovis]|uniref:Uncharacterized protein n=1 Tax=Candidatus Mycoplasma haematobovis TaxID=432608 RepID=A0A1A9QBP3_9MOLU|nr:hypothetical protein [Candidatus Mycoplasma haematobovis]OAL10002.1 hypothetical protein A6V39_03755 [Candidatus Mycoplasma haematobovis]